ncbi:MAG: hypothetical protein R3E32_09275 [Chitinophagales bacterium]
MTSNKKIILDWYDGIVEGFIEALDKEDWVYVKLVAWDMANNLKVYCVLDVDKFNMNVFFNFFEHQKPEFPTWVPSKLTDKEQYLINIFLKNLFDLSTKKKLVISNDIEQGVIKTHNVNSNNLYYKDINYDIEAIANMSNENLQEWLNLFT